MDNEQRITDNGPKTLADDAAMPRAGFYHDADTYDCGANGLTKREYFAVAAMQGMCGNAQYDATASTAPDFAKDAVIYADALIAALNEKRV